MRILNLGAGVQSTAVFLMAHEGIIPPIDHAIFADTQEEPQTVYDHLEWLRTIGAPVPLLHVATAGKLGDDILCETAPSIPHKDGAPYKENHRHRFASIPAFTGMHHDKRTERDPCNEGIIRRQCTKEYKIEVVEKVIRRVILQLKPRQRIPKGILIDQIFGISLDESGRAKRIAKNWEGRKWSAPSFPLIELKLTRADCLDYLKTSRASHSHAQRLRFLPVQISKGMADDKSESERMGASAGNRQGIADAWKSRQRSHGSIHLFASLVDSVGDG